MPISMSNLNLKFKFNSKELYWHEKHTFTLPKQVSKYNEQTVEKSEHIYSWRGYGIVLAELCHTLSYVHVIQAIK